MLLVMAVKVTKAWAVVTSTASALEAAEPTALMEATAAF